MKALNKQNHNNAKDAILISKIFESFEALEETLGGLKLEEPLFITYVAKKAFAQAIMDSTKKKKPISN